MVMLDQERAIPLAREPHPSSDLSELIAELRAGRREALDSLLAVLYPELRRIASRELAARPSDTLSATALVNELYLKFVGLRRTDWSDRAHVLSVAAIAMRCILVDHARRHMAGKRGGAFHTVTLDDAVARASGAREVDDESLLELLELHDALDHLAATDERLARVVECRFFGGMTEEETAEALFVTERTVRRDWVKARGLLHLALTRTLGA